MFLHAPHPAAPASGCHHQATQFQETSFFGRSDLRCAYPIFLKAKRHRTQHDASGAGPIVAPARMDIGTSKRRPGSSTWVKHLV